MKMESLVIADQHAAVNMYSGLVHTARHTMEIDSTRSFILKIKKKKGKAAKRRLVAFIFL